jgi:hypothetical protein
VGALDAFKVNIVATIRPCQKVAIWNTYQNFCSEDDDRLSIINSNRAYFAKLGSRGLQEATLHHGPLVS